MDKPRPEHGGPIESGKPPDVNESAAAAGHALSVESGAPGDEHLDKAAATAGGGIGSREENVKPRGTTDANTTSTTEARSDDAGHIEKETLDGARSETADVIGGAAVGHSEVKHNETASSAQKGLDAVDDELAEMARPHARRSLEELEKADTDGEAGFRADVAAIVGDLPADPRELQKLDSWTRWQAARRELAQRKQLNEERERIAHETDQDLLPEQPDKDHENLNEELGRLADKKYGGPRAPSEDVLHNNVQLPETLSDSVREEIDQDEKFLLRNLHMNQGRDLTRSPYDIISPKGNPRDAYIPSGLHSIMQRAGAALEGDQAYRKLDEHLKKSDREDSLAYRLGIPPPNVPLNFAQREQASADARYEYGLEEHGLNYYITRYTRRLHEAESLDNPSQLQVDRLTEIVAGLVLLRGYMFETHKPPSVDTLGIRPQPEPKNILSNSIYDLPPVEDEVAQELMKIDVALEEHTKRVIEDFAWASVIAGEDATPNRFVGTPELAEQPPQAIKSQVSALYTSMRWFTKRQFTTFDEARQHLDKRVATLTELKINGQLSSNKLGVLSSLQSLQALWPNVVKLKTSGMRTPEGAAEYYKIKLSQIKRLGRQA